MKVSKEDHMYEIIRAGTGYNPVILASPPGSSTSTPGAKFFELSTLKDRHPPEGWVPNQFNEICSEEARYAFYGMADAWGFADIPPESFGSIAEVESWISEARKPG